MGEPTGLVRALALALREHVLPSLGSHAGRAHSGAGEGGDITFAIDEQAESFLEEYLAEHAPGVAFYSEDRGLVEPAGESEWVLVVDPIDGTRPAMAGLESACVSVAAARLERRADHGGRRGRLRCRDQVRSGLRGGSRGG